MRSFYWSLADKSAEPTKPPKPFADGQTTTFEQAERGIRETIGKAYKPEMGYQYYAGPLAVTFSISTGEVIDFTPYLGRQVTVVVLTREGATQEYVGIARVEHYDFVLTHEGTNQATHITPSYIKDIILEGAGQMHRKSPTGGRTFQGRISPGCTGSPGYMPGTVDHFGMVCPLHER